MILAMRTDKPEAELYLVDSNNQIVASYSWQAHRELSDTLLAKVEQFMTTNDVRLTDITNILVYQGPGSFTGLRIGISVANTLGFALEIPVIGIEGEDWLQKTKGLLTQQQSPGNVVIPKYGAEANVTAPRK